MWGINPENRKKVGYKVIKICILFLKDWKEIWYGDMVLFFCVVARGRIIFLLENIGIKLFGFSLRKRSENLKLHQLVNVIECAQ